MWGRQGTQAFHFLKRTCCYQLAYSYTRSSVCALLICIGCSLCCLSSEGVLAFPVSKHPFDIELGSRNKGHSVSLLWVLCAGRGSCCISWLSASRDQPGDERELFEHHQDLISSEPHKSGDNVCFWRHRHANCWHHLSICEVLVVLSSCSHVNHQFYLLCHSFHVDITAL